MMLILAIIVNFIFAAWLYPELFTQLDFRMIQGHETCGPMDYVFYLIGQFYQGGIQLFDRYDLFNSSFASAIRWSLYADQFYHCLRIHFTFAFCPKPAEFYHHWYVFSYYGLGLVLRTFGIYILLFI